MTHSLHRSLAPLLLSAVLGSSLAMTGCQRPQETTNNTYNQWEHDTNRRHMDLNKRSPEEQKQYQDWARSHGERH